jgi:immunoglobulin-like protein involved in spore germination
MMRRRLFFLGVLACLAAGCGSSETATTTVATTTAATTTTATTTTASTMALTVFEVDNGLLRPKVTKVPRTAAVAGAALGALGIDASVSIADGTATVAFDRATQDEQAEIVYTLTQFPAVQRVDVAGRKGLTREDFASYVPPILIESPAAGAEVPSPVRVSGTASVFEATLVVQLVRDGKVVAKRTVTASEGAPGRGSFETSLQTTPGDATVSAFAPSAADGSPQHRVDVAVTVVP